MSTAVAAVPSVKVSSRNQIALPSAVRQKLGIQAGQRLLIDVQDGVVILMAEPQSYVEHMTGLHKDVWEDVDTNAYLEEARGQWRE